MPDLINPIASHILPKNNIIHNNENYKDNHKIINKEKILFIINKILKIKNYI